MNTQVHKTTRTGPYELGYRQKHRSVIFPTSAAPGVISQEDLTDDGPEYTLTLGHLHCSWWSQRQQREVPAVLGKRTVTKAYIQAVKPASRVTVANSSYIHDISTYVSDPSHLQYLVRRGSRGMPRPLHIWLVGW